LKDDFAVLKGYGLLDEVIFEVIEVVLLFNYINCFVLVFGL